MARKAKSKLSPTFTPRIRFNWGYHDAADDWQKGCLRVIVDRIPVDANPTRYVLRSYDRDYTRGYEEGGRDARDGVYAQNSEAAWKRTQVAA